MCDTKHYSLYPFAIADKGAGGLPSVFLKEARLGKNLTLFTTDSEDFNIGDTVVKSVHIEDFVMEDLSRYWYGIGCWQWLHPDAHIDLSGDFEANRLMLQLDENTPEVTYHTMAEFCNKNEFKPELDFLFNSRFDNLLASVEPGSILNWQDYFFATSIINHSQKLRELDVYQTFHLHTSLPSSLINSTFGQNLLKAMSCVDTVYLHTDEYIERAKKQMKALNLNLPIMQRFDLGIDEEALDKDVGLVKSSNEQLIKIIGHMASNQEKDLVLEILSTQNIIPHRFISVDRIDPSKGNITVIKAVLRFLEKQLKLGVSLEKMNDKYRFYFIQPNVNKPFDANHMKNGFYGRYALKLFVHAKNRFPDIVYFSDSLSGNNRQLIPGLMLKAHGITGGSQDGLNLAIQENIYINRKENTSAICGDGAGFFMHVKSIGLNDCGFFPKAGNIREFTSCIEQIVSLQIQDNHNLKEKKLPLVEHITQRTASIVVDE